jgi:hypothetical protein
MHLGGHAEKKNLNMRKEKKMDNEVRLKENVT